MLLIDELAGFLEYLEIEQNRSLRTIENYHYYLLRLDEFKPDIKVEDLDKELIRKWRVWLNRHENDRGESLSKATQNYPPDCSKELFEVPINARPSTDGK
jgi:site-specific recombinase XerD